MDDRKVSWIFGEWIGQWYQTTWRPDDPSASLALLLFGMPNAKPMETPLLGGLDLSSDGSPLLARNTPYRQPIGALLHLSNNVWSDIAYAVWYLSRFMHCPTTQLWKAAKYTLRYLKGTEHLGLSFRSGGDDVVKAFLDSDWGQERWKRNPFQIRFWCWRGAQ